MNAQLVLMEKKFKLICEEVKKGDIEKAKNKLAVMSNELFQKLQSLSIENQISGDTTYGDTLSLLGRVSQIKGHCLFLCGDYKKAIIEYRDAIQIFVLIRNKNSVFNGLRYLGSCDISVMNPEYLNKHKKSLIGQYDADSLLLGDLETYGRLLAIGYNVILHVIPKEQLDPVLHPLFLQMAGPYIDEYKYL
jgi:hypothetical protein